MTLSVIYCAYDIEANRYDPHSKMREHASKHGWYVFDKDFGGINHYLPNTTFMGYFEKMTDAQKAFYDLSDRVRGLCSGSLTVEKMLIVMSEGAIFSSNKPFGAP